MYLANEDPELRAASAEALGLPYEEAKCGGCRNASGTKGIDFCYQCQDFPCDHLHPYADQASVRQHNTKLFNLCLIKKMGLEEWARVKAKSVKETYFNGKLRVHSVEKSP
jgi:hypothetical protein